MVRHFPFPPIPLQMTIMTVQMMNAFFMFT